MIQPYARAEFPSGGWLDHGLNVPPRIPSVNLGGDPRTKLSESITGLKVFASQDQRGLCTDLELHHRMKGCGEIGFETRGRCGAVFTHAVAVGGIGEKP